MGLLGDIGHGLQAFGGGIQRGLDVITDRGMRNSLAGVGIDPNQYAQLDPLQRRALRSNFLMNLGMGLQHGGNVAAGAMAFQDDTRSLQQQLQGQRMLGEIRQVFASDLPTADKYRKAGDIYSQYGATDKAANLYDTAQKYEDAQAKLKPPPDEAIGTPQAMAIGGQTRMVQPMKYGQPRALGGEGENSSGYYTPPPKMELVDVGGGKVAADMSALKPGQTFIKTPTPGEQETHEQNLYTRRYGEERNKVLDSHWAQDFDQRSAQHAARLAMEKAKTGEADIDATTPDPASSSILAATGMSYPAFLTLTGQQKRLGYDRVARRRGMEEAQNWANTHNIDVAALASSYDQHNKNLASNLNRLNMTEAMESELEGTIENLQDVITARGMKNLRWENVLGTWRGQETNDPLASRYAMQLDMLRHELAAYNAATQGRGGSGLTIDDMHHAENVIKNGLSSGGLTGLRDSVRDSAGKMGKVMRGQVDKSQRNIWNLFGVQPPPKPEKRSGPFSGGFTEQPSGEMQFTPQAGHWEQQRDGSMVWRTQ